MGVIVSRINLNSLEVVVDGGCCQSNSPEAVWSWLLIGVVVSRTHCGKFGSGSRLHRGWAVRKWWLMGIAVSCVYHGQF